MINQQHLKELFGKTKELEPTIQKIFEVRETVAMLRTILHTSNYENDYSAYERFLIRETDIVIYGYSHKTLNTTCEYVISFDDFCNAEDYIKSLKITIVDMESAVRRQEILRIQQNEAKVLKQDTEAYDRLKKKLNK